MTPRFDEVEKRDLRALLNAFNDNRLVLRPRYQRNPVWLEPQKAALIDTILRGYPIPEIYMQDLDTDDGGVEHVVVDGQQRLRSCIEYLGDEFALDEGNSPEWGDARFSELPPDDQTAILDYSFVIRLVPPIPEEEVRIIFKRLNQNVLALNRQELRHATYWGPFLKSMEALAEDEFWQATGLFTSNDIRRMLDVELISELAVAVLNGPQNKKDALDEWYAAYEQDFSERGLVERIFRDVTGELQHLFPQFRSSRWRNRSDFYTLFLVFAKHVDALPLSREGRELAHEVLREFGEAVSAFTSRKATTQEREAAPERVQLYGSAVQRAASDMGSRITREEQLEQVLADVW